MRLSYSRWRESVGVWTFWTFGPYLALELGPILVLKQVFHKSAGEIVGPYLAFAAPAMILFPLVWYLRKWEERGALPKRLALWWGLLMALFASVVLVAFLYSGLEFNLIDPSDIVAGSIVVGVLVVPTSFVTMYRSTLARISARAAKNTEIR